MLVEDADTDDETAAERADRDKTHQEFAAVKVKQEPIDPGTWNTMSYDCLVVHASES